MARCPKCWNSTDFCVCASVPTDQDLALSYLAVLAVQPHGASHPKDAARAKDWVRRCAVRDTGDPHGYDHDPWGAPVRAALRATGLTPT